MKDFWLGKSKLSKIVATVAAVVTIFMFLVGINSAPELIGEIKGWTKQPEAETGQTVADDPSGTLISTGSPTDESSTKNNPPAMDLMTESNVFKGDATYHTVTNSDLLTANNNQEFKRGSSFYVGQDGSFNTISFLLNGEYKYISGYFYLPKEYKNLSYNQYFSIIGDGKTLYESEALTAGVEPIEFKVNVEEVKTIVFEFSDEDANYNWILMSSNRSPHYLAEVYAY